LDRQYHSRNRNNKPPGGGRFGNYNSSDRHGQDTIPDYYGPSNDQQLINVLDTLVVKYKKQPTAVWDDDPPLPIPHFSPNGVALNHSKANPGSYLASPTNWGIPNISNDGEVTT
jgi:hypothetical protein